MNSHQIVLTEVAQAIAGTRPVHKGDIAMAQDALDALYGSEAFTETLARAVGECTQDVRDILSEISDTHIPGVGQ